MSAFDYRDPGCDPEYCDGLEADDDTELYAEPLDQAKRAVLEAIADFAEAIREVETVSEALTLRARIAVLTKHCARVERLALSRADELYGRRSR